MGWADWMIVELTMEEELHLEQTVREIQRCNDPKALAKLCVDLTKQQWHQSRLLKQAVGHIASLDSSFNCREL
jgi:hypothetical protein